MTGRRKPQGGAARNAAKTHCDHGHEFTPANTYRWTDPQTGWTRRYCRTCRRNARSDHHRFRRPA
jgi:hypothetical protein